MWGKGGTVQGFWKQKDPASALYCLVGGECSISYKPNLFQILCYASDTKHHYFPQGAQMSQTKPLRKPNVQNKTIYTRLAPATCPPSYPSGAWDAQRVWVRNERG